MTRAKMIEHIKKARRIMIDALRKKIATEMGLIALGRSEIFELFFEGETPPATLKIIDSVAANLILAKYPVISVNGNAVALAAREIIELAKKLNAKIEINLLYRTEDRIEAIRKHLKDNGAPDDMILIPEHGTSEALNGISTARRFIHKEGIVKADVVLVLMEDGDRTRALVERKKKVIALEINPLSPTAAAATIALIDNILRALPALKSAVSRLKKKDTGFLKALSAEYIHDDYLAEVIEFLEKKVKKFIEDRKPMTSADADTIKN